MADIDRVQFTVISTETTLPSTVGLRPLSEPFTYASSCTSHWVQPYPNIISSSDRLYSGVMWGRYFKSCLPGGYTTGYPYYSPGVCPNGHHMATITESITLPAVGDDNGRIWLGYCCPSGFGFSSSGLFCTSSMSRSSPVVAYRGVAAPYTITESGTQSVGSSLNYDATINSTLINYPSFLVDPIGVIWKASDLSKFEPQYASALASRFKIKYPATTTPSTLSPTGPTATPGPSTSIVGPTSTPPPGLTTSAKAGIGVGAAIGALGIAALVLLIFWWRKRKMTRTHTDPTYNVTAAEAPELVQYYNPIRQSDAMSGTTYAEYNPKSPTMPMSPRQ